MQFSTIFMALFYPFVAHEQTAHEQTTHNLDFVSSLVALPSYSYWSPLLPKLRFVQEQVSDFKEWCAQLCQFCTIHWKELVTPTPLPPTYNSILLWQHNSPHFDTHSLLLREWVMHCGVGGLLWQFHTMKCAIFTVSIKNWGSDVAAQINRNILAYIPPIFLRSKSKMHNSL